MSKTVDNLIEFLERAYKLTAQGLKLAEERNFDELLVVLDNRERAIAIVQTMSERYNLEQTNMDLKLVKEFNNQVNQIINRIAALDDVITTHLEEERTKTQNEIAKTFKNKENFKGYNLNKLD